MQKVRIGIFCLFFSLLPLAIAEDATSKLERGKYLVTLAGCNDCHTSGFGLSGGTVPESEWLKGDPTGWHGPWGTTYPINLRRFVLALSEEQWVRVARNSQARPPMPSYLLRSMKEEDLRAIYTFIRSLPVAGENAPAYIPPGTVPNPPYFTLVMPKLHAENKAH